MRRRFAGIIVDVCYDHFLSKHWSDYSEIELSGFISHVYEVLEQYYRILPERLQFFVPTMVSEDWLGSYQSMRGVEAALHRTSNRLERENTIMGSIEEVECNYERLERNFLAFFPDLNDYATRCSKERKDPGPCDLDVIRNDCRQITCRNSK